MKIAIIGVGNVGATLGKRWSEAGHDVTFAVRSLDHEKGNVAVEATGGRATLGLVQPACEEADVILLATQYGQAVEALNGAGAIDGKPVLDATNPLKPDLSGLSVGHDTSAAEEIAKAFPQAHIVKAFNTTGFNIMAAPPQGPLKAFMPIAGDDGQAKETAMVLADEIGFEVVDAGPLSAARLLEPMAMLWISMAYRQGLGRDYAFSLNRLGG